MQLGDQVKDRVRAIRWLDLSPRAFMATECGLTDEEFRSMGLIQRQEYEEAKSRQPPRRPEARRA